MASDYTFDTIQWILISIEFASMLLFSISMFAYCKRNKPIKENILENSDSDTFISQKP